MRSQTLHLRGPVAKESRAGINPPCVLTFISSLCPVELSWPLTIVNKFNPPDLPLLFRDGSTYTYAWTNEELHFVLHFIFVCFLFFIFIFFMWDVHTHAYAYRPRTKITRYLQPLSNCHWRGCHSVVISGIGCLFQSQMKGELIITWSPQ